MTAAIPGFVPQWTAPAGVRAFVTTREAGHSTGTFARFNLGDHVGDDPDAVAANRRWLRRGLALPADPAWLNQVHGTHCTEATASGPREVEADAAVVRGPGAVAAVLTADCLPVILARDDARAAAVAHAGWRGLAGGVLEAALTALGPVPVHAFLGPAIGPAAFEVGPEVRAAFLEADPGADAAFAAQGGKWRADLYRLARRRLMQQGLPAARISGGDFCTFDEAERFYSHRREAPTGRMATLVWLGPG
ncbi:MAG TPA: peptidoglycan editing factor PgeF [Gammaproteobacteria bacterium]|nr:peptidoglycan editing factor PgeF [Gammaproteobacteria bacterium]